MPFLWKSRFFGENCDFYLRISKKIRNFARLFYIDCYHN